MFTHVDIDRYTVHVCSLFGLGTALNTTTSITRKGSFDKTYKQLLGVTNLYQIWMYEKCTYEQCMCIYVHIYNIIFIHMNNAYFKYVFNWIMCVYISIYIYIYMRMKDKIYTFWTAEEGNFKSFYQRMAKSSADTWGLSISNVSVVLEVFKLCSLHVSRFSHRFWAVGWESSEMVPLFPEGTMACPAKLNCFKVWSSTYFHQLGRIMLNQDRGWRSMEFHFCAPCGT